MKRIKKTFIQSETREIWTIRRTANPLTDWCEQCRADVRWLHLQETTRLTGLLSSEIFRRVEAGTIHFMETDARLLFCFESIFSGNLINESRGTE
jgi:hypothetical protein